MKIQQEPLETLTFLLRVTVEEADYSEAVEKTLRDYKKKANIPGFRPGMVPIGVVNRMYRKGVVAEETFRIASEEGSKYLENEKIDNIGELIPSEKQGDFDFDNNKDHEFVFEYGVAPEVKIEFDPKKDKLNRYILQITKEMHDSARKNFIRKHGRLVDVEQVEGEEALTVSLDNGKMQVEEAFVGLISRNDEERQLFIGRKVGDSMQVDMNELYKDPSQRASTLNIKPGELAEINPLFELTIKRIRRFTDPELDAEFFKTAFPAGDVTDEKGFDTFIDAQIALELSRETEYLFALELRDMLLAKADLVLPEPFIRRWLTLVNKERFSQEEIDRDFPAFAKMMQWNIIKKHYATTFDLTVSERETLEEAKAITRMQFAQYGMTSVPDEMVDNYAHSMTENRDEMKKVLEQLYERKVIEAIAPMIGITEHSIDIEAFGKLVDEYQQQNA